MPLFAHASIICEPSLLGLVLLHDSTSATYTTLQLAKQDLHGKLRHRHMHPAALLPHGNLKRVAALICVGKKNILGVISQIVSCLKVFHLH